MPPMAHELPLMCAFVLCTVTMCAVVFPGGNTVHLHRVVCVTTTLYYHHQHACPELRSVRSDKPSVVAIATVLLLLLVPGLPR